MDNDRFEQIKTFKKYISRLLGGIDAEIELCQTDNLKDFTNIMHITEGMESLLRGLTLTGGIQNNNDNEKLLDGLKSMEESIKNNDLILLSDTLEYEYKPLLKEWLNICMDYLKNNA